VTEAGLQAAAFIGLVIVASTFGAVQCGKAHLDSDLPALDSGDTEPSGCIEETGESDPPDDSDSGGGDTSNETAPPVDTWPPPDTGLVDGCPVGMASIGGEFCMDRYEASRPDATSSDVGSNESHATTRLGVLPWKVSEQSQASAACEAAGKRLCTEEEWTTACMGPAETTYAYGDSYEAETCNGIDSNCDCDSAAADCACDEHGGPYRGCYSDCGGSIGMEATGSRDGCTNPFGVWDINGNVWEYVDSSAEYPVRGGAYNCGDSSTFHRCDFVPTWNPSARGFRCCHDGSFR
jgi:sulfatase modifying factor 1